MEQAIKKIQDINEETRIIKEFEEALGIPKEEFPEELLNEIRPSGVYGGDPLAGMTRRELRGAGEQEWKRDLAQHPTAQQTYPGAAPRDLPSQKARANPNVGDFVKVGNELLKVARVEQMYGNSFVFFDQPGSKPVMVPTVRRLSSGTVITESTIPGLSGID